MPQLPDRAFELGDRGCVVAGRARPLTGIDLGALAPGARRLPMLPELVGRGPRRSAPLGPPGIDRRPCSLLTQLLGAAMTLILPGMKLVCSG
ncbi:hypothetical protein, partial [Glycomyces tenuis]|uniref:hypothetical protein n=1 Tax=Glycomyces tenuis TaxID=58116 RepID=UPI001B80582B